MEEKEEEGLVREVWRRRRKRSKGENGGLGGQGGGRVSEGDEDREGEGRKG